MKIFVYLVIHNFSTSYSIGQKHL